MRRGLLAASGAGRPRPAQAVFFCVKSHDTPAAVKAARPWVGPRTAVVGLQNGIGHEAALRRAFGPARTVIGSCYFAADRPAPLTVSSSWGNRIDLARAPRNGEALAAARGLLKRAGWDARVEASQDRMLWTKLCFNAATNPLGAACAAPNGRLAADPALKEIMLRVLDEALAIARRAGHRPLYGDMARFVTRSASSAPLQRNSMLQDLQAGRRTEIDAIAGPLLAAGKRTGLPAPLLSRLSRLIRILERAR